MAAQKRKKCLSAENFVAFLNASYPKTHLIQSLNSSDSSKSYGGMLENQKTGSSKELFLPNNDFQNSSLKMFPKKHADIGGLETNKDMKFRLEFFCTCTYKYNIILKLFVVLNRNIFKVPYVLWAKFLKNQPKRLQN